MQLPWKIAAFLCLAAPVAGAEKPNFVFLVSEDNSVHYMQLYSACGAATPRIEQLAESGLVFEHAFSNAPVCSVARTSLITSCFAPRVGTQFHRRAVPVPLPDGLRMFPSYLRQAGYFTSNNDKKDYNAIEGDDVWTESSRQATWRHRAPGQPFFHMQNFPVTHESSLHFPETALEHEPTETDPADVKVFPYLPDTPLVRYTHARYLDRIRQMDSQVGHVVDQLAEDGLLEDTFIFYFGDNGGVLPRSKGFAYDSGLHVPLVVRVPERWQYVVPWTRGSRVRGFVSFVDFGPTLLHLAGVAVPPQVDGHPFLGTSVSAVEVDGRNEAWGYADRFDEKSDLVRTLRKGRFEYVRSYQPANVDALQNNYRYQMLAYQQWRELAQAGELDAVQQPFFEQRVPEMLFDLQEDPYETRNLAGDSHYQAVLVEMRHRLGQWVRGLPDLSFYPENHLVEAATSNPTQFGQTRRQEIIQLIDLADTALGDFATAHDAISQALGSDSPWDRYWGLIVCSTFGSRAVEFVPRVVELSHGDANLLVRTRAAEFLGLRGAADPRPMLLAALAESRQPQEAALILNTIVLLRDTEPGYEFTVTPECVHESLRDADSVQRRLQYLRSEQQE